MEYNDYEAHIHWFSIFNSFMIVVFLAGLVALIMLRTLKLDYLRYSHSMPDISDAASSDDSGWKRVHADVFRSCPHYPLYCVLMVASMARLDRRATARTSPSRWWRRWWRSCW